MKKLILYILFVCLFVSTGWASYTYTITEYQILPNLTGIESMLITSQGGGSYAVLFDNASLTIERTSPLGDGTGGVWDISLANSSHLNISGGQVYEITINNNATAFLAGGLINQIYSYQVATIVIPGQPPQVIPNPHITIECLDHFYNTNTKLLTGHWFDDGTAFSIQLIDVQGYSPAIQNIQFIPEPVSLFLFGLGGLFLRQRRK